MEIWKQVVGYEGLYEISNEGRVRRIATDNYHWGNTPIEQRILKPRFAEYKTVHLSKHGVVKTVKIARLVAHAFISNPFDKPQVNHKDGDKYNDTVDNLEWCTRSENSQHALKMGFLFNRKISEATQKKVIDIKTGTIYKSISQASREIGMKRATLSKMLTGVNRNKTSLTIV